MSTFSATLHDGSRIAVVSRGQGPALLLPVRWERHDPETAEQMRAWGADPDAGPTVIDGLAPRFRVIAADYEGHRLGSPAPDTLTADTLASDLLAIADAAGAARFAYYGYSWLALAGLQLAIRTDRLWALVMGGFPPLGGPYASMLSVTQAAHAMATAPQKADAGDVEPGDWDSVTVQMSAPQTRQFVTLYESLTAFDDASVQEGLSVPRLAFAGAEDNIEYGAGWGNTVVRIGEPLMRNEDALKAAGWDVRVLPGLNHMTAMASGVVLPLLAGWLPSALPMDFL
jgi:pimeloyl-ACP methyl ester carboxylesterase